MSGFGSGSEGFNPFEGILGDLAKILGTAGGGVPLNWDVARQVSVLIATQGETVSNVDPVDRIRVEELSRVAELHINEVTALDGGVRSVDAITPVEWAARTLDAWKPVLEKLAGSLSVTKPAEEITSDPNAEMMAQMQQWISPALLGMQAGGMIGHLSRRTLGQFDLPVPRAKPDVLVVVPANIKTLSDDWSLPIDELTLFVCIEEMTRSAILRLPHVSQRFQELLELYVSSFEPDNTALEERLSQLDMNAESGFPSALSDPHALLGSIQSASQVRTLAELSALVAAFVGFVDHVVERVSARVIPSAGAIAEAAKRRRVEESDGTRLVEKMLGLEMAQPTFDRGDKFIAGVIERVGEDGLTRLWASKWTLPTPAEVDAPGLWLERIDLPEPN